MKVVSGLNNIESAGLKNVAATLGTFDGVHLGHRKIIETLMKIGVEQKLNATLITFKPHPQLVLGKRGPIELLTTFEEKMKLLENTGIDTVVVLEFNSQLASYPPEDFIKEILIKKLDMRALVFGYDHAFGKDRAGNRELLENMAKFNGFSFTVVPEYKIDGLRLKSTPIRKELKSGDYKRAVAALGYNYFITGKIIKGHGVGKKLGYPTVNLALPSGKLLPKEGVYAATARFDGQNYAGMAYIGRRLTFDDETISVEINLFDFSGKIESDTAVLELLEFIRPPGKFGSPDELASKIKEDEKTIRDRIN
ncbi:MAG: bifunctional riboflavin kinase/FAD synthetase [Candidatus Zixiibacteriota bacterium]|nr:MAG: bifunctional riboflavin kinase/FAD synthetase [candidate division Zixibacteria bacterium]